MNRRVAWIVGLALCLGLLVQFVLRPGADAPAQHQESVPAAAPPNASSSPTSDSLDTAQDVSAPATATALADNSAEGSFRGRIIDAITREPVREFEVTFHARPPTDNAPVSQSFHAADGRFVLSGIPAGHGVAFAKARGYQRFELALEIAAGKATQEIVMPLRAGYALRGRVSDETSRKPIGSATISVREAHQARFEGGFRNRPSAKSQPDGSFVLDGLPAGSLIVAVQANNYAYHELDVNMSEKSPALEIALSTGGTIAGYLAGPDGVTPAAGNVTLLQIEHHTSSTIRTGPAGEFSFKHLQPGRHRLAGRSGGLSGERDFALSHAEQLEGIVLSMTPAHSIRGIVSGVRQDEIKQVTVTASHMNNKFSDSVTVPVDEGGAFILPGIAPGPVLVTADVSMQRQLIRNVEMPTHGDLTVILEFPRGARLTGHVSREGKPLGGVWVSPHPRSASNATQQINPRGAQSSSSGDYVIEDIPNGEYSLYVEGYLTPPMRIAGDTVFDIEVPAPHLAGRVLEDSGTAPIVGAMVDIRSAGPTAMGIRLVERSDHFGQFALRGLQPGDYVLSAHKPGYELYRTPLAYGSPVTDMTIRLRPGKGVEVRVLEAGTGSPIPRVSVVETVGDLYGTATSLQVDDNGVGHLPSGMAGSTLVFSAPGYNLATIRDWNGQALEVSLQKEARP